MVFYFPCHGLIGGGWWGGGGWRDVPCHIATRWWPLLPDYALVGGRVRSRSWGCWENTWSSRKSRFGDIRECAISSILPEGEGEPFGGWIWYLPKMSKPGRLASLATSRSGCARWCLPSGHFLMDLDQAEQSLVKSTCSRGLVDGL